MTIDAAELELFRDNVKRFLENEIQPHYEQWEKDSWMPRDIWNKLGENGLLCVDQPEQYGGVGVPFQYSMVILNEMAKLGLTSLATGVSVHSDICAPYIEHLAVESVKAAWLPKLASGEAVAAIGMTEPGAGSDLAGIRTTAVRDGDFYVVNGSKTFISNGQHADVVIMAVKTDVAAGEKQLAAWRGGADAAALGNAVTVSREAAQNLDPRVLDAALSAVSADPADHAKRYELAEQFGTRRDKIIAATQQGSNTFKIEATPTFIINGELHPGGLPFDDYDVDGKMQPGFASLIKGFLRAHQALVVF